jgi:hypothetical protein
MMVLRRKNRAIANVKMLIMSIVLIGKASGF